MSDDVLEDTRILKSRQQCSYHGCTVRRNPFLALRMVRGSEEDQRESGFKEPGPISKEPKEAGRGRERTRNILIIHLIPYFSFN